MTTEQTCCQSLAAGGQSPFVITELGGYDGFTSGLARCSACGRAYHFELVASDEERGERAYGFKEVAVVDHHAITALVAQTPPADDAVVMLRVRDALSRSLERNLFVLAAGLDTKIRAIETLDVERWRSILKPV